MIADRPALAALVDFLRRAPAPEGLAPASPIPEPVRSLASRDPGVAALVEVVLGRPTAFSFGQLCIEPAVLLRDAARHGGSPDEICLARTPAGDVFLWHAQNGSVRRVAHDQGWSTASSFETVDRMIERTLERELGALVAEEIEELAELAPSELDRVRFAVELVGREALDADVLDALVARGLVPPS